MDYDNNGVLTKQTVEPQSQNSLTTTYRYEDDRKKLITTVSSKDGTRESIKIYDDYGRLIKTINALNFVSTTEYDDFCFNQPKSVTDINGLTNKL